MNFFFKNRIYFASDKLYCLNTDGKEEWNYSTSSSIDINFTLCNNFITLIDKSNIIYSIHTGNGYYLKKSTSDNSILSFLCAQDKIFTGNQKGEICILR